MNVEELSEELRLNQLSTSGEKPELVARLQKCILDAMVKDIRSEASENTQAVDDRASITKSLPLIRSNEGASGLRNVYEDSYDDITIFKHDQERTQRYNNDKDNDQRRYEHDPDNDQRHEHDQE